MEHRSSRLPLLVLSIINIPAILLLDEATSEALDRIMKGRTTLVVAHRLSTIMNAAILS